MQADPRRLVGRVVRGDSALRVMWRTVSRALSNSNSARDLVELTGLTQIPLSTGRRIAVTSVRGGAGKSAIAALLASTYAFRRADQVLAADADPHGGSLLWRLGLDNHVPLAALAPRLLAARDRDINSLNELLPRTGIGLWVLPGGVAGQSELVRDVTRALSRLFAVCVTDCGLINSPATVEVLSEAHAVVIVAPATPDGVHNTFSVVWQMAASRSPMISRVLVVLNKLNTHGVNALRVGEARDAFRRLGVCVVTLPYDRHVAGGAPIIMSSIGETTLVETTRLAGHALDHARPL